MIIISSYQETDMTHPTSVTFTGEDEVEVYAFIAIRRALKFRVETGGSLMRGREIEAARKHNWTTAKTAKKALEDMNRIAVDCGLSAI